MVVEIKVGRVEITIVKNDQDAVFTSKFTQILSMFIVVEAVDIFIKPNFASTQCGCTVRLENNAVNLILCDQIAHALPSFNAKLGKIDWLAKYIPELSIDKIIIIVGSGKKCDYIREAGILVDDDKTNINQWIKAGYQGILLKTKGEKVIL